MRQLAFTFPFAARLLWAMLAWACLASGRPAAAASFACEQARSGVEKRICADPQLSELDEHLARYYAVARDRLGRAGAACLVPDQRRWLRGVRDACTSADCLRQGYLRRLAELDPLQPGASALKRIELPAVPSLVWIVPPAADRVAAPPVKNPKPLVLQGHLLNELTQGDGFVLLTPQGKKHLLLPSMFVDDPAPLASLATMPQARYEVRGGAAPADAGIVHFELSACTFIYRLP